MGKKVKNFKSAVKHSKAAVKHSKVRAVFCRGFIVISKKLFESVPCQKTLSPTKKPSGKTLSRLPARSAFVSVSCRPLFPLRNRKARQSPWQMRSQRCSRLAARNAAHIPVHIPAHLPARTPVRPFQTQEDEQ